jgi:cytochrome P450
MQLDPRIDNLLSERDERRHADLRSKMLHAYTGKEVPAMEAMIDERVHDLINLIQHEGVTNRRSVDFAALAQYFTLDSLTHIAFGQPVGFLTENKDLFDYNAQAADFLPVLAMGASVPAVNAVLKSRIVQALAGPKATDKSGMGAIVGWAQQRVRDRFQSSKTESAEEKGTSDMLDSFMKHGLTQLEAESESMLQLLAGSDSTATSIRMAMLFLLTNPAVYAKLRAEIDAFIPNMSAEIITIAEAAKLPYLQAVIREAIRIWQPLTGVATKLPPPEGTVINGVSIPGGTELALAIQSLTTRKDLFGEDAEIFRPERWIEASEETYKLYEKNWDLTFAFGRFTCPGKGIALLELNKVTFEV